MSCILTKNRITCFRLPKEVKSVVKARLDGKHYYCRNDKDVFDAMDRNARVEVQHMGTMQTKQYMRFGLEFVDTIEEHLMKVVNESQGIDT